MAAPYFGMTNQICVLLIDHDKESVSRMVDLLKAYEYKVRTVDTALEGMSMISKGKEKIDAIIINMNSPNLLSFPLLDQAVASDIVPFCLCDKYDACLAKKAFQTGAYLYLEKPLHQEIVKYLWQFVLRKKIQKEKDREGLEENGDHLMHVDNTDKSNMSINIVEMGNNIHETTNVVSNEMCKLKRKRGGIQINGGKSRSSVNKVVGKKSRIKWTEDLHAKFVKAVNQLDEGRCFPSDILKIMNVPDLTRLQVASHLQKCRDNAWRVSKERKSSRRPSGQVGSSSGSMQRSNNARRVPKERKSTRRPSSQVGSSSGSMQRSNLENFGTISHLKTNVTNLQQQQQFNQETPKGPEIPFLPNNNIFARGESSTLQQVYQPQLQVDPKYLNPFATPFLPENATVNGLGAANINFQQYIGEPNMSQPNNIVTTSHVSDTQGSGSSERINCDADFDFSDMDYLFENCEYDNEFDQIYSDDMVPSSVQFPDITKFRDVSST